MKMLLTLLIALLCAFGLSACGSNAADTPNKDTQQNQTDNNAGNDGVSIANMGGDQNLAALRPSLTTARTPIR